MEEKSESTVKKGPKKKIIQNKTNALFHGAKGLNKEEGERISLKEIFEHGLLGPNSARNSTSSSQIIIPSLNQFSSQQNKRYVQKGKRGCLSNPQSPIREKKKVLNEDIAARPIKEERSARSNKNEIVKIEMTEKRLEDFYMEVRKRLEQTHSPRSLETFPKEFKKIIEHINEGSGLRFTPTGNFQWASPTRRKDSKNIVKTVDTEAGENIQRDFCKIYENVKVNNRDFSSRMEFDIYKRQTKDCRIDAIRSSMEPKLGKKESNELTERLEKDRIRRKMRESLLQNVSNKNIKESNTKPTITKDQANDFYERMITKQKVAEQELIEKQRTKEMKEIEKEQEIMSRSNPQNRLSRDQLDSLMTRMRRDVEDRKEKQMILQETKTEKENEQMKDLFQPKITYYSEKGSKIEGNTVQRFTSSMVNTQTTSPIRGSVHLRLFKDAEDRVIRKNVNQLIYSQGYEQIPPSIRSTMEENMKESLTSYYKDPNHNHDMPQSATFHAVLNAKSEIDGKPNELITHTHHLPNKAKMGKIGKRVKSTEIIPSPRVLAPQKQGISYKPNQKELDDNTPIEVFQITDESRSSVIGGNQNAGRGAPERGTKRGGKQAELPLQIDQTKSQTILNTLSEDGEERRVVMTSPQREESLQATSKKKRGNKRIKSPNANKKKGSTKKFPVGNNKAGYMVQGDAQKLVDYLLQRATSISKQ